MKRSGLVLSLAVTWGAIVAAGQPAAGPAPVPSAASASLTATPAFTRTEDVVYDRKFGHALTLDVFQPTQGANGYAIIYLISSGWESTHENIDSHAKAGTYLPFLTRGYTVFSVVHSSQPKYALHEFVPDIHRAVRFIRHNAAHWGINPDRLGVTGASAGGHLSLTLGTQGRPGDPGAKDPIDRESSAVQAVACFYPPTDFLNYGKAGEDGVGVGLLKDYAVAFGPDAATPEGRQKIGREFSPIYYVTPQMAPTLIVHGDADDLVPIQQSQSFVRRATELHANARLVVKAGGGHGWRTVGVDRLVLADWFDEYLRGIKPRTGSVAPISGSASPREETSVRR